MRIIAGSARSVPLKTPPGQDTRPLPDLVKKSLFSILDARARIEGAGVWDLYAGSGTIGIEALSRGAAHCVFVERSRPCCGLLLENLKKARLVGGGEVIPSSVEAYLARPADSPDLVFLDPPFETTAGAGTRESFDRTLAAAFGRLAPGGWMVLRIEERTEPFHADGREPFRVWKGGRQKILFFEKPE